MNRPLFLLLSSLFLGGLASDLVAGPHPGRYVGSMARVAPAATPKVTTFGDLVCRATNPSQPLEDFSTNVLINANQGADNRLLANLEVLPNGTVRVFLTGAIKNRTTNRTVAFNISAVGGGAFTPTSFATTIRNVNLGGTRRATVVVSAKSTGPRVEVIVSIDPARNDDPLGDFRAVYSGVRPILP